jgi:pyruvate,orthophosphate dikinase
MKDLEAKTGKHFGGADNPLLVSVRSGSSMSMPGMMDTILNLGLNKTTLQGLIKLTGNPRFGYDAYRRFIQLFGKIALGVEDKHFDDAMAAMKKKRRASQDVDLSGRASAELASTSSARIIEANTGKPFPEDPYEQLESRSGGVPLLERQARRRLPRSSRSPRPRPTARRSISAPWCSATWATTPAPASASPATPAPART